MYNNIHKYTYNLNTICQVSHQNKHEKLICELMYHFNTEAIANYQQYIYSWIILASSSERIIKFITVTVVVVTHLRSFSNFHAEELCKYYSSLYQILRLYGTEWKLQSYFIKKKRKKKKKKITTKVFFTRALCSFIYLLLGWNDHQWAVNP